ncbi:glycosyltransferase family 4 protein [Niabella yanshanensis]|uniref:Glycosyltransferase family 4 protein n=1 Tax=Niabella yanshanensis TaxID=577386 RepID=A0ABZ0W716_9BACT|nr:glycosyltransferase family 4 protein [Niabella yanshanensis]WQD39093.1 glycosyltransferase family 4 protein [Niabella yanshanensis]
MKKTIVHIVPSLKKGGAERFTVNICNELSTKEQYSVHLVSLFDNKNDHSTFLSELDSKVKYVSLGKRPGFSLITLFKLYSTLKAITPDIVHTHINAFEYGLPYIVSSAGLFVHTIHSKAEKECPNKFIKTIRRRLYKKDSVIPVTISKDGSHTYRAYYKLNNDILIENGCPQVVSTKFFTNVEKEFSKKETEYLLVHIGRIVEVKNQKLLIGAVNLYNSRHEKKIRLLIVGGIRDQVLFKELNELIGSSEQILFVGDKNNVGDYLLLSDAFCLSSVYEGLPMSLIEAFSAGCIPTCTPVGGITEVIEDGVTGFLSSDMSTESYYNALYRNLHAPNRDHIKVNCLNAFEKKYSISACSAKYDGLYDSKIKSKK